ncbi:MAG: hypothetical protein Q4D98_13380 [Planctomycetia bacterium]|nr:hypothetical protein [Planctomycetia bacterium]
MKRQGGQKRSDCLPTPLATGGSRSRSRSYRPGTTLRSVHGSDASRATPASGGGIFLRYGASLSLLGGGSAFAPSRSLVTPPRWL